MFDFLVPSSSSLLSDRQRSPSPVLPRAVNTDWHFTSDDYADILANPKHDFHFLPLSNHDIDHLESEVQTEEEINQILFELEEKFCEHRLIGMQMDAKKWIYDNVNGTNKGLKDYIDFFEIIFPENFFSIFPSVKANMFRIKAFIDLSNLLLKVIDSGLTFLTLTYKNKILNEATLLVEEAKQEYEESGAASPVYINKYETTVEKEKERLKVDYTTHFVKSIKKIGTSLKKIVKLYSITETIPSAETIMGFLSDRIKNYAQYEKFWDQRTKAKNLKKWNADFEIWKKSNQHQVKIDPKKLRKILNHKLPRARSLSEAIKKAPLLEADELSKLQHIIDHTDSLLLKKQAILEKKRILLRPQFEILTPEMQRLKSPSFTNALHRIALIGLEPGNEKKALDDLIAMGITPPDNLIDYFTRIKEEPSFVGSIFTQWFDQQPKEALLTEYIERQSTIEHTIKLALQDMITKKNELESKFLNLQFLSSHSENFFYLAIIGFNLALLLNPSLALPATLLRVSKSLALTFTVGLSLAQNFTSYRHKSHSTGLGAFFDGSQLLINKFHKKRNDYLLKTKKRNMTEAGKLVCQTYRKSFRGTDPDHARAIRRYAKAKAEYKSTEENLKDWSERVEALENQMAANAWQDFSQFADLKSDEDHEGFDTLRALSEAFNDCNSSLLDPDTHTFLRTQMGLHLPGHGANVKRDPRVVTEGVKKFFTLMDSKYLSFIAKNNVNAASA
jgi:hypothetical protein